MTIYATGNPVGSTNPKDLIDNSQNLDYLILGPALLYPDRRGVNRLSWAGIEAAFAAAQAQRAADYAASEANRGYENPVPYDSGIALTRVTQLVQYESELYKAKAGTLPWTTTGIWATDSAKLVSVGDNALRQDLAKPDGSAKSGWWGTTVKARLDQTLSLRAMGCNGIGDTDDTARLVDAFSRTNIQIDTGGQGDVYFLRHDTLMALTGENRLQVRDGVRVIGNGKINILSNQLADGTRIEMTGNGCYVGPCEIAEVNPTLGRYNVYGTLSARGAINFGIDRTRVTASNGAAIHVRNNSQNFLIQRPYIRNAKADGIHIQRGSRDFAIDNPDIRQVEDDCIGVVGHGKNEGYTAPGNGVITGGYYGYHQNGAVGSGIALIGCHDVQVLQPIIRNTGLSGIRIAEETSQGLFTPRNITIVGADIDKTGLTTNPGSGLSKEGIFVSAGYKITILKPIIYRAKTHGISISGPNVDVEVIDPTIKMSGGRGVWLSGGTATGDFITEIWGDDDRGVGAVSVKNEYMRLFNFAIDRSVNDGFYLDGTAGALVEPDVQKLKIRRSNMGNTSGKYGIFLKDAANVTFVDFDGGASGSATALQAPTQFATGITTGANGLIDEMRNRFASLTVPMQTKYGKRVFWNSAFPTVATGVEGGYTLGETIRNANSATGTENWLVTAAGDPGTWAAK